MLVTVEGQIKAAWFSVKLCVLLNYSAFVGGRIRICSCLKGGRYSKMATTRVRSASVSGKCVSLLSTALSQILFASFLPCPAVFGRLLFQKKQVADHFLFIAFKQKFDIVFLNIPDVFISLDLVYHDVLSFHSLLFFPLFYI